LVDWWAVPLAGHKASRLFSLDGRTGALANEIKGPETPDVDMSCAADANTMFVGRNGVWVMGCGCLGPGGARE
jgi:hypothetical protein